MYLHYVFDLWLAAWPAQVDEGLVGGGEHGREAERFLAEFQERLAEYGLEMHPDKTRLIEFGRWARDNRRQPAEGEPESFVFLGFTYSCRTNGAGDFTIWPRSVRRRVESKLQAVKQTLCPDA